MIKGEVLSLTWDQVDLKERVIRPKKQKTQRIMKNKRYLIYFDLYKVIRQEAKPWIIKSMLSYKDSATVNLFRERLPAIKCPELNTSLFNIFPGIFGEYLW